MEASGFTEMVKKLKPSVFEDIVAAGALYRPGPLESGMVDVFINRKHGREKVTYPHPKLETILKDTYGVNKFVVGNTAIMDANTGEWTTVESLFDRRRPFAVHALGDDGKLHVRGV